MTCTSISPHHLAFILPHSIHQVALYSTLWFGIYLDYVLINKSHQIFNSIINNYINMEPISPTYTMTNTFHHGTLYHGCNMLLWFIYTCVKHKTKMEKGKEKNRKEKKRGEGLATQACSASRPNQPRQPTGPALHLSPLLAHARAVAGRPQLARPA